jgi:hypothetical protein
VLTRIEPKRAGTAVMTQVQALPIAGTEARVTPTQMKITIVPTLFVSVSSGGTSNQKRTLYQTIHASKESCLPGYKAKLGNNDLPLIRKLHRHPGSVGILLESLDMMGAYRVWNLAAHIKESPEYPRKRSGCQLVDFNGAHN